jgi:hypothetical protein
MFRCDHSCCCCTHCPASCADYFFGRPRQDNQRHLSLLYVQPVYGFASGSKDAARFLQAAGHADLWFLEDREVPFQQVRGPLLQLQLVQRQACCASNAGRKLPCDQRASLLAIQPAEGCTVMCIAVALGDVECPVRLWRVPPCRSWAKACRGHRSRWACCRTGWRWTACSRPFLRTHPWSGHMLASVPGRLRRLMQLRRVPGRRQQQIQHHARLVQRLWQTTASCGHLSSMSFRRQAAHSQLMHLGLLTSHISMRSAWLYVVMSATVSDIILHILHRNCSCTSTRCRMCC